MFAPERRRLCDACSKGADSFEILGRVTAAAGFKCAGCGEQKLFGNIVGTSTLPAQDKKETA